METGQRVRVLLVEDMTLVREGFRSLLDNFPNLEVVGEAGNGEDALQKAGTLKPTIVLMDVNMPKMDGVTATRLIKQNHPQIAVVGLTADAPEYVRYSMLKVGAFEVVMKGQAVSELYSVIQRAVASVRPILVLEEQELETTASIPVRESTIADVVHEPPSQLPPDIESES
jgi:DNA-binding NarL/FixJ family response regulator